MKKLMDTTSHKGAEEVAIYYQERLEKIIDFENNRLNQMSTKNLKGVKIEAVVDGKVGSLASSNLTDQEKLTDKVIELASFGDPLRYEWVQPGLEYSNTTLIPPSVMEIKAEQLVKKCESVIENIREYDKNIRVNIQIVQSQMDRKLLNSTGLELTGNKYMYKALVHGVLIEGDNFLQLVVQRTAKDGQIDLIEMGAELIESFKLSRINQTMESGRYPVIFTPKAVAQMTLAMQGFFGDDVAKGVSPLRDKLNTQIFDPKITLVDDGLYPEGPYSDLFDDEGSPTQKTLLVENGVLKNFIYDLESAAEMGVVSTGNGWRRDLDYKNRVLISFTNLVFRPGHTPFTEMLSQIDQGLVIDDITGLMMGNLLQGNINSDIDMAYKIEKGKLTCRVKNGAIGTNLYKILKDNVVALGDQIHEKLLMTGHAVYAPYIFCKDINITFG